MTSPDAMTDADQAELSHFEVLVASRRTNLRMDLQRPVPMELIERLCAAAVWAPNHKRTWPWRFAMFKGDGRAHLGQVIGDEMARAGGFDAEKIAKNRTKYGRAPMVLAVGSVLGDRPSVTAENRDAVAAAIENLLLAATAAGLGSYWSSCSPELWPVVSELCGFETGTAVIGLIYLGWLIGDVPVPERPVPELRIISD
ncbi:MAG: nitroreductase family protein [Acidimicrobiia bacterium]